MLTALTGALAGLIHVVTGPDHLAAVGPLAVEGRSRGWVAGWTWGIGHSSGVVVVAVLAVLLRDLLPPIDTISAWSERLVGAALVVVGFGRSGGARACSRRLTSTVPAPMTIYTCKPGLVG
jgi:hydrogenase/urease accessory protein HupE